MDRPESQHGGVLRRLAAQSAATRALARADTPERALELLLEGVARALGCSFAACWRPLPELELLHCVAQWTAPGEDLERFAQASRDMQFGPGAGLPGRVWSEVAATWVADVHADEAFPRLQAARDANLRGGVAFPALADGKVAAVLEFFSHAALPRDEEMLHLLSALGVQVGEFLRRKETEAALTETQARFRIFAETASDALFTTDHDSTILYVNPAVERVFGYRPDELIGRNLSLLIPERLRQRHREGVEHHVRTGERRIPWNGVELPGLHRDGHEVPLEISFGEFVQNGRHYFTGIARDISDRIRDREQLELQKADLEAANRAKSDFLMTMSHELRTPLNAMMGYTDLLMEGIPEPVTPPVRQKISRIGAAARHLLELIEEILSFSRIEAGQEEVTLSDVAVGELLDEVQALAEPLALEKGLELQCRRPPEDFVVRSDARKLRQILVNLIGNAVKFTEQGHVRVEAAHADGLARFAVSDTGPGIDPAHHEDIFAAFWQVERGTTRNVHGTGLGLTVSHRLALMLGGDIELDSEPGRGATFTLVLPLS